MINRLMFFAVLFLMPFSKLHSQNYNVGLIPDSLKENAHIVIREYIWEIELQSINSGVERMRKVLTILDKEGENKAYLVISYDKNSRASVKQVTLYDGNGKIFKKIKLSDIIDTPSFGESLYSEDRIKFYKPDCAVYPYTVEYIYEISSENMLGYGYWRPINDYNISVESSILTLTYPKSINVNRKEVNIPVKSSVIEDVNNIKETWQIKNLKAIESEPYTSSLSERTPNLYLMPAELIYDEYKGVVRNWEEFGKWIAKLYNGKDIISEDEKEIIASLLKDVPDTLDRIKTLYKYMQRNTRYVSITLGIGGYQPFDAKTVFETGYGDCKALSNYMCSLLKLNGIKSYPAVVSAGRNIVSIYKDYPNFYQFNHVILCVPYKSDTIWLECTSQTIPFGFLGDFTDDRDVLLITESGGKFAHTKKYEAGENLRVCNSHFIIDSTGTANCNITTVYQGLQYDDMVGLIQANYDDQKKALYESLSLPSSQIKDFSIQENKESAPNARINKSVVSRNYCSFAGKYMIIPLNLINVQDPMRKMLKTRYSDIIIYRSFIDFDTLIYQIPQNYILETLPKGKIIKSEFGEYSYSVTVSDNSIVYTRRFSLNQGRYAPSAYIGLYDFILSVSKSDNIKVMLIKGN